jgi:aerobic-type carbon monoxide dehydrogenase small subunit (CoxS/CutS family)
MPTLTASSAGSVTISADGRSVRVPAGVTVAAALLDLGVTALRRSVGGEPRGPLCGMGTCYECRVTIDGVAHRRACLVLVTEGMHVTTAAGAEEPS